MKNIIKELWDYFTADPVSSALYKDGVMIITYRDGKVEKYEGSATVWYELPLMKRCDSLTESMLCDLWKYNQKWGGAYPDAHKKGKLIESNSV